MTTLQRQFNAREWNDGKLGRATCDTERRIAALKDLQQAEENSLKAIRELSATMADAAKALGSDEIKS